MKKNNLILENYAFCGSKTVIDYCNADDTQEEVLTIEVDTDEVEAYFRESYLPDQPLPTYYDGELNRRMPMPLIEYLTEHFHHTKDFFLAFLDYYLSLPDSPKKPVESVPTIELHRIAA